jgi:hypothetical protein
MTMRLITTSIISICVGFTLGIFVFVQPSLKENIMRLFGKEPFGVKTMAGAPVCTDGIVEEVKPAYTPAEEEELFFISCGGLF